jgi:hypothetical protein
MKYIKYFENLIKKITWSCPRTEFIKHGYEFRSYYYFKKIGFIRIRCYLKGKEIELSDVSNDITNLITYYLENSNDSTKIHQPLRKELPGLPNGSYIKLFVNRETNEIVNDTDINIDTKEAFMDMTEKYEKSGNWNNVVMHLSNWDNLINELIFLTDGKIKETPSYIKWDIDRKMKKYNI